MLHVPATKTLTPVITNAISPYGIFLATVFVSLAACSAVGWHLLSEAEKAAEGEAAARSAAAAAEAAVAKERNEWKAKERAISRQMKEIQVRLQSHCNRCTCTGSYTSQPFTDGHSVQCSFELSALPRAVSCLNAQLNHACIPSSQCGLKQNKSIAPAPNPYLRIQDMMAEAEGKHSRLAGEVATSQAAVAERQAGLAAAQEALRIAQAESERLTAQLVEKDAKVWRQLCN